MKAYGKASKRRSTLEGHQNCAVCHEEKDDPRGMKKRARREGKEEALEESGDRQPTGLETQRDS